MEVEKLVQELHAFVSTGDRDRKEKPFKKAGAPKPPQAPQAPRPVSRPVPAPAQAQVERQKNPFEHIVIQDKKETTISLKTLKKPQPKSPSKEHLSDLRKALTGALSGSEPDLPKEGTKEIQKEAPKEVPEEKLKKLFK